LLSWVSGSARSPHGRKKGFVSKRAAELRQRIAAVKRGFLLDRGFGINLNKGEAQYALVHFVFLNRGGEKLVVN